MPLQAGATRAVELSMLRTHGLCRPVLISRQTLDQSHYESKAYLTFAKRGSLESANTSPASDTFALYELTLISTLF